MKVIRTIFTLFFLLITALPVVAQINYVKIKKTPPDRVKEYSGQTVEWEGTLEELISNEAYFEYVFLLPSGDKIKVLSDRGLVRFKTGDYIKVKGFIMVKDGVFSHLVLKDATPATKPLKIRTAYGTAALILLHAPEEVIYRRIYKWILYYNSGISKKNASFIANRIVYYSRIYKTDPFLVTAIISAESAFNTYAVSVAGAIGLGQLMPGTAAMLGVNPYDPDQNIMGSVIYIKNMLRIWANSKDPVSYAIASYNAGPGAVSKYGGIPPYRETMDYVKVVLYFYSKIRKL